MDQAAFLHTDILSVQPDSVSALPPNIIQNYAARLQM